MKHKPSTLYARRVRQPGCHDDPAQRAVVAHMDAVWTALVHRARRRRWWHRRTPGPARGLYLWGGVGRGKTWLMDLFYESLPFEAKERIHFHRFMARVHEALRERADRRDPLVDIARHWAEHCRVLCFDEFHVSDIADAMLLAGLLEALFEAGVTLVATSNLHPSDLYRDGLQRAKFLPAIELIERHTHVVELAGARDYRLRFLKRSKTWHAPHDEAAREVLHGYFRRMAGDFRFPAKITVGGRSIPAVRRGEGVAWFTFDELCRQPRGTGDYIEIARSFNTVLLSDIPALDDDEADAARRFIHLVDEFYERNVKLLATAATGIEGVYDGQRLAFEFERTRSRLTEMQSEAYLARPHLP